MNLGPVLLLVLPMFLGGLAYLLRNWRLVPPLLATGAALGLGLFLLLLPLGPSLEIGGRQVLLVSESVVVLGRELVLTQADRLAMAFIFLTGAGLFFLAWRFDKSGLLPSIGLGMLGLLGAVLVVQPLVYAALFLQIAAALAVFPLHAEATSARGGLRYLSFYTLALPGLLVSHWVLERYAVSPDQQAFLYTATVLIGLSFALMLGIFPFHAWVPAVGADGAPLTSAFLYTVVTSGVWFLLLDYLQIYPWLSAHRQWQPLLSTIGSTTVIVGGLLGTTRRSPGALMGYAVMVDTGLAVVALGQGTQRGIGLAIGLLFARALGVLLMASGLEGLRRRSGEARHLADGLGRQAPWSTLAVLVGGLSLAGFPPTVGFAARWGTLSAVLSSNPSMGLALLLASLGTAAGLLQLLASLLQPPQTLPNTNENQEPGGKGGGSQEQEPLANKILLLALVVAVLAFGIFPSPLAAAAGKVAALFTFFAP
ncbi:MAG: proton-conducting transporter membrane subunit [Anaerolineae bacterium]|jgi:formate hydrogenlyase subunit 3/multisubunit Na+/H+ antiporter MnhD subunit